MIVTNIKNCVNLFLKIFVTKNIKNFINRGFLRIAVVNFFTSKVKLYLKSTCILLKQVEYQVARSAFIRSNTYCYMHLRTGVSKNPGDFILPFSILTFAYSEFAMGRFPHLFQEIVGK